MFNLLVSGEENAWAGKMYSMPIERCVRSHVVVDWGGEVFEFFSKYNNADFSYYSKWLISSIREYRKKGKWFIFPRRVLGKKVTQN